MLADSAHMMASACPCDMAARYGRSAVSASKTSATATIRAPIASSGLSARGSSRDRRAARDDTPPVRRRPRRSDRLRIRSVSSGWRRITCISDGSSTPGLSRMTFGTPSLPKIVKETGSPNVDHGWQRETKMRRHRFGDIGDALRMRAGQRALGVDDVGERACDPVDRLVVRRPDSPARLERHRPPHEVWGSQVVEEAVRRGVEQRVDDIRVVPGARVVPRGPTEPAPGRRH